MQSEQQAIKVGARVESLDAEDAQARGTVTLVSVWGEGLRVQWDEHPECWCRADQVKPVVELDAREHRHLAARHRKLAELAEVRVGKPAFHAKYRNTQAAIRHESLAAQLEQVTS